MSLPPNGGWRCIWLLLFEIKCAEDVHPSFLRRSFSHEFCPLPINPSPSIFPSIISREDFASPVSHDMIEFSLLDGQKQLFVFTNLFQNFYVSFTLWIYVSCTATKLHKNAFGLHLNSIKHYSARVSRLLLLSEMSKHGDSFLMQDMTNEMSIISAISRTFNRRSTIRDHGFLSRYPSC